MEVLGTRALAFLQDVEYVQHVRELGQIVVDILVTLNCLIQYIILDGCLKYFIGYGEYVINAGLRMARFLAKNVAIAKHPSLNFLE
jgi:hypothetical protein